MNSRRKICHLIWALEPGGAERQVISMAQWQKQRGNEVSVVCLTRKGLLAKELEAQGIAVTLIQKNPGMDFGIVPRLSRYLKRQEIQILHTHVPTAGLWGRLAAIFAPRCRVIVSEHSDMAIQDLKFRFINRVLQRRTDQFLAVSEKIRERMIEEGGISAGKIEVMRNGIAVNGIYSEAQKTEIRKKLNIPQQAVVIGSVGRLEPRKDYASFVSVCCKVLAARPQTYFILVGDGICRDSLEKQAAEFGMEKSFCFAGTQENSKEWIAAMDIFVLSSLTEGISISLLEAMDLAKVCVVTEVGGNPEVIQHGHNGRLVAKSNPSRLAEEILSVIDHPEEAKRMGQNARQTVLEKFSVDRMMRDMERVYEGISGK